MLIEKNLSFDRDKFINDFLDPISKVTDIVSLIINTEGTTAVCFNEANVILFARYTELTFSEPLKINIQDIKRFIRLLECIKDNSITLEVTSNTLNYKSSKLKFKYHLADDVMVPLAKISIAKINALTFDSKFWIDKIKTQEILKGSSVISNSNKLYFTVSKEGVIAELTDQQQALTDSVAIHIVNEFEGKEIDTPLAINLDVFRLITGLKFDKILININTEFKVLMFEACFGSTTLKYIVSSLVK